MRRNNGMTSRERMLAALNHQEPDQVPLYLHFVSTITSVKAQEIFPPELRWEDQFERAERFLDVLHVDDILRIVDVSSPDFTGVDISVKKEYPAGEADPLIMKEYRTPKGVLRQVMRQTPDWPFGDDAPFCSDLSIPRGKEFLIKEQEDIDKLRYLLKEPSSDTLKEFRRNVKRIKQFADERQILVEGHVDSVGTTACHLVGMSQLLMKAIDDPGFALELFDVLHKWEMLALEILLDTGAADVAVVNGFYESLQLWSPELYRKFFFQPFREKIAAIHQAGLKCGYNMTSNLMPLIPVFKELDFDILRYLDPIKGESDLAGLKKEIGDSLCFLGGVSGAITVGTGRVREIEEAVMHAIRILAPGGGLILSAADAIYEDAPWTNVMALINCWKEAGKYPLQV